MEKSVRNEMAKAAQMISDGVKSIISIFPSIELTDEERRIHVGHYAYELAKAMAVAKMFGGDEINFGPTYSVKELAKTIENDLKKNPNAKV